MSHEFRTPLTLILGHAELLESDAVQSGQTTSLPGLGQIQTSARDLLRLVEGVLNYARLEADELVLQPELVDVAALVHSVAKNSLPLLHPKQRLLIECAPEVGWMEADITYLRQMLLHLLSNAVKFTPQGTITLHARRKRGEPPAGDWLILGVADTGIGIPPAQHQHLFKPFMQGDSRLDRRYGGAGLGLAITARLCELMGGQIEVESVPGQGSTFTLRLPARGHRPPSTP